jgi:hypothetical protein
MLRQARGPALALALTLLSAGLGHGQSAPTTVIIVPGGMPAEQLWRVEPAGPAPATPHGPAPGPGCGPPACAPFEDHNGPLLIGDPLLDGPGAPGWLAAVDAGVVVPHLKNRLRGTVPLPDGTTDEVHLPTADLGWRVMPRFELGYRWGQGTGELIFAYRFLTTDGNQTITGRDVPAFAPAAALRSRFDLQVVDLDYGSYERSLGPLWDMKWRIGLRFANIYFDSRAANAGLEERTSDRFVGVGPHLALDLRRWIGDSGLAWFGRLDASSPIGRIAQSFEEVATAPGAAPVGGAVRNASYYPPVSLGIQLGVTWAPARSDCFRMTAGYTYEHWWDTGTLFTTPPLSRAEITIQGLFVRAEWNY